MDEVTLVDLDLGTCEPPPGDPRDDARLLPWSDRLQAALQVTHFPHNRAHAALQAPCLQGVVWCYNLCQMLM